MGSLLSSCSRMVTVGSFDMVGVPPALLWEVVSDIEAFPSFVPDILAVQTLRGETSSAAGAVGASWNERRIYYGKEILMRKTITSLNLDPEHATYIVKVVVQAEGISYSSPDAVETCTFTIAPLQTEDGKGEKPQSCTFSWTMAYISAGLWGTCVVLLFKSCLLRSLNRYIDNEMQYYYKEAIRRTKQQETKEEKSSSAETNSSLELGG